MVDFSMYEEAVPSVSAYKCPTCGTLYHPVPMVCRKCNTRRDPSGVIYSAWEKVPLEGRCRLLTWTRVWNLPEGYDVKYLLFGIAEFENGLRASARLLIDDPQTGMTLYAKAGVVKKKGDKELYGLMLDRAP